jgi:hypothetical protein
MLRYALPSCILLGLGLAACGKGTGPKSPQVSIPAPMAWDGTPPAAGSVTFASPLQGDASKFVAYEVDPDKGTVTRTVVDDIERLQKLVPATISNPMGDAGTIFIVWQPPPPPPDGQGLVKRARAVLEATEARPRSGVHRSPDHQ